MKVEIWTQQGSQPIIREFVEVYQKGNMYCVFNRKLNKVEKFPLCNIFKVVELNETSKV